MNDLMELVNGCRVMPDVETKTDVSNLLTKAQELESLGLMKAAKEVLAKAQREQRPSLVAGFICVTTSDIEMFLEKKVREYDKKHKKIEARDVAERLTSGIGLSGFGGLVGFLGRYNTVAAGTQQSGIGSIDDAYMRALIGGTYFLPTSDVWRANKISRKTCDYLSNKDGAIGQFVWDEVEVKDYTGIPPQKVLDRLKQVGEMKIFDYFTIASMKEVKDPIIFGRFEDDNDNRYFVDQWGDDVKIEDLM